MQTIERQIKQLAAQAEEIRDTDAHSVPNMSAGEVWWQGDVGVQFLGDSLDLAIDQCEPVSQLAPGNTQGSRHVLKSHKGITFYKLRTPHALVGNILHCEQGLTVTHPEHGDITFQEPGWYGVRYQRKHAEELRRVQD